MDMPYKDLLPPLSTDEFEALQADIKANGVLVPIVVDENGVILDGHHRYKIDNDAPRRVVKGLSESEKQAFTIRANLVRRNLSPEQKRDIQKRQKEIAKRLREEDAKRWTQKRVAEVLGVAESTVRLWENTTNRRAADGGKTAKEPKPDARVKLNTAAKRAIAERVIKGEKQEQVAADFGVSQQTISKVAKQAEQIHSRDDDKARKTAHLKASKFDVRRGDFRQVLKDIEQATLILTDPPYPKDALHLWDDLGEFASRSLADDGILVAYSGQMFLPKVLSMLSVHLDYWWCGAVVHKGSGNLTPLGHPVRKVINGWKPLVMFTRKGCGVDVTFRDRIEGVGPEKTHHNWQQPEAEAAAIIETFTKPGQLVVDPFAGSGAFCKAAHDLGRIAVGAEILNG